jgi:hypothetical protein
VVPGRLRGIQLRRIRRPGKTWHFVSHWGPFFLLERINEEKRRAAIDFIDGEALLICKEWKIIHLDEEVIKLVMAAANGWWKLVISVSKVNNTASAIPMRASDFGRVSDHEFVTRESSRCYAGVVVRRRVVSSNIKYTAASTLQLKTID